MTEFVPAWMAAAAMFYAVTATLALLVTFAWGLLITDDRPALLNPNFTNALRDRVLGAAYVALFVGLAASALGLVPLAEVAGVVCALLGGAKAQFETMGAADYYSTPRGETA